MFDNPALWPILWEWLSFAVRWLHVVTAIAWIGSAFYFLALGLRLVERPQPPARVDGGGLYQIQKYLVAPASMPEHLTWFKWESYVTWLSGAVLLAVVYYGGGGLFLLDNDGMGIAGGE